MKNSRLLEKSMQIVVVIELGVCTPNDIERTD